MTPQKSLLSHAPDTAQPTTKRSPNDWQARHFRAMRCPVSGFECALVALLRGWQDYAAAHRAAYDAAIHDDGVLGESWTQIGEGLLGLLNGQLDRLDGGSLDHAIRSLLEPADEGAECDANAPHTDPVVDGDEASDTGALIFAYTRAEALADGVLVDVTATAQEAGFRLPVALTQALWADIHAVPEQLQGIADPQGRLWDVLMVGQCAIMEQRAANLCRYSLEMPVGESRLYEVKAHCGPGDRGEPVLTFMQLGED